MGLLRYLILKEEAHLFDTKVYLMKSFVAVWTGYIIAIHNPLLKLDIISILFALMMTLEPVTMSSLKSGWEQIYATAIGAIGTVLIVSIFGINSITIALSVCFTLYISILINWRFVSPVAIFTAIYMTQYVQMTMEGLPSPLLTFRLRMVALVFGVVIAVIYNFIFSIFAYKKLPLKRVRYLLDEQISIADQLLKSMATKKEDSYKIVQSEIQKAFGSIDSVLKHLEDMQRDVTQIRSRKAHTAFYIPIVRLIRDINHLNVDIAYIGSSPLYKDEDKEIQGHVIEKYEEVLYLLRRLSVKLSLQEGSEGKIIEEERKGFQWSNRIEENVHSIYRITCEIYSYVEGK